MKITIEVPDYSAADGFRYTWENGFHIETMVDDGIITIRANKEGLTSLANHLVNLAQEKVPSGHHLHFDSDNSLEEGSIALVIQKM